MKGMYSDVRHMLKTGDLVFFSGEGFVSNLIKIVTRSQWSHVGMVVRLDELDSVLLWESTTLSNAEDIDGTYKHGVQLVSLSDRINLYRGEVAYRLIDFDRTPEQLSALGALRAELKDRPYERSLSELVESAFDWFGPENTPDLSSCFCSEIVAAALQKIGLLSSVKPSNEFTPSDLVAVPLIDNTVQLNRSTSNA